MVKICLDLDGVICNTKNSVYRNSTPKKKIIKYINYLYDQNHHITIFTARYMGRTKGNLVEVNKKIKPLTLKQLKIWGVKYHKIYFGKPSFDLFIDDKSIFFKKDWSKLLKKKLNI